MRRVRVLAVLLVVVAIVSHEAPVATAAQSAAPRSVAVESDLVNPQAGLVTNGPIYDMERIGTTTYLGGDFDYIGERTGPVVTMAASTGERTDALPAINRSVSGQRVVYAAPPDDDGGWYLAGGFALSGDTNIGVAHVDAAGQVLWSTPVSGRFNQVRNIEVHDDTILVAGSFNIVDGETREGLAALDRSTGSVLPWTSSLTQPTCGFEDATLANGVVYVVGNNCIFSSGAVLRAINYPSGTTRLFNPISPTPSDPWQYNVEYFDGLVMTNTHTFDEFSLPEVAPCPIGNHSTRVADVIYAATETGVVGCDLATGEHVVEVPGNRDSAVSADDERVYTATDGMLNAYDRDTSELVWTRQTNGSSGNPGRALVIAVSGANVVAADASASSLDVQPRGGLAALDSAGAITSWGPVADGTVRSLAVDGDRIVAGGEFTEIDGTVRSRLAGLDSVSGTVDGWDPNANGTVVAVEAAGGVVFAGGQFTKVDEVTHNRVVAISGSGDPVAGWTTGANSTVTALEVSDGDLYVGGVFATMGGLPRSRLAKLDAATGAVADWDPGADDFIRSIAATGDAVYVGGGFSTAGGQPRSRVAALDPVSGAATSWDPGADGEVWAIAVDAGLVYLGGAFTHVAGDARASLAAIDTTGTLTDWNPAPTGTVYTIVIDGGVVSAAGLFGTASNIAEPTPDGPAAEESASEAVQVAAVPGDARSLAFSRYVAPTLPPGTVSGTVTDALSGAPVPGAFVAVLRTTDFSLAGGAVADGSGNYSVAVPPGDYFVYLIDATGAHTAGFFGSPTTVTVPADTVVDADPIMVPTRGSISGTVVDDVTDAPIANALVVALTSGGVAEIAAVADSNGDYTLGGLRPGNHYVGFVDPTGDHRSEFWPNSLNVPDATTVAVTAGDTTVADSGLSTQSGTATGSLLTGTVVETGTLAPVEDVVVLALHAGDFRLARAATTNSAGEYSLDVQAGAGYKLAFLDRAGRHGFEWHDSQPNTGLGTATTVVAPAVTDAALENLTGAQAGTITDQISGDAIDGAWVFAIGANGLAGGAVTAPDGTYTIGGLAPGTYRATIVDPNGGRLQQYFDNSVDYDGATPFNITAANTTPNINAALAGN